MPTYEIHIGVDESGTGALAGPFTVAAVAAMTQDFKLLREAGAKDSKGMSDGRRRTVIAGISDVALFASCEIVGPEQTFNPGQKMAWRLAIGACVSQVLGLLPAGLVRSRIQILIDGNADPRVRDDLRQTVATFRADAAVRFRKKADQSDPAVGAASIIAKTVRNDEMLKLHKEFPQFGWNENYGYGTPKHREAIERLGVTPYHRRIKSLLGMKKVST